MDQRANKTVITADAPLAEMQRYSTDLRSITQGRGIFDNLKKFIVWTLPTNVGESFVLLAAILLGTALPMLPVQLLWINMTAVTLLGTRLSALFTGAGNSLP